MKKALGLVLAAAVVSAAAFAQQAASPEGVTGIDSSGNFIFDTSVLDFTNQIAFNNNKLSVQSSLVSNTVGSSSTYASALGRHSAWGNTFSSSTTTVDTEWDAYQGGTLLSKPDFLRLTGNDALATRVENEENRVRKWHTAGIATAVVGGVAFIGGLIWMYSGILSPYILDFNFVPPAVVASVGCVVMCAGIPMLFVKVNKNLMVNLTFAVDTANVYNQNLYRSLRRGE